MYWKLKLKKNIFLNPEHLGPAVHQQLRKQLREAVECQQDQTHGLIVCVIDIENLHEVKGRVLDDGRVLFELQYSAIAWKSFRGDIIDGVVTDVAQEGFLVDVGAVSVFVSGFTMPADVTFKQPQGDAPKFCSADDMYSISSGIKVRVAVLNETPKNKRFAALATVAGEGLGPRF